MVPGRMQSKKSFVRISSICSGVSTFGFLLNIDYLLTAALQTEEGIKKQSSCCLQND